MATLIQSSNSYGQTGRCDAKCYDAKGLVCNCTCGGRNHGVGLNQAKQNVQDHCDEMIKEWKETHPDDIVQVTANSIQGVLDLI